MSVSKVGQGTHKGISVQDLAGIAGDGRARQARSEDAVDGVEPDLVVEPESVEEASDVLALASRSGIAVIPRGAGTKLHWGNRPSRADLIVSTARLNQVLEHASGDLVVRVGAGTPIERLQAELAKSVQRLALDPPEVGATVGGIVAANASGPLRHRFGTVRDVLIGITCVLPNGTVAKSGGKVVKNVAGYDLGKLFTGSLGTLGLLVEAIFRLHPVPAARRTVAVRSIGDPAALGDAVQRILHSSLVPAALEFSWDTEGILVAMFEGIAPGVEAQVKTVVDLMGPFGDVQVFDEEEQRRWWEEWAGRHAQRVLPSSGEGDTIELKIGAVPNVLPHLLRHVLSLQDRSREPAGRGIVSRLTGHAGSGITFVELTGDEDRLMEAIREIRQFALGRGGSAVVRGAPLPIKQAVEVWGPVGDALPLMRRVKEQFDPDGIMSPGRFVGGI
jgi:glycolate oxidase FAD binding subunit